MFVVPLLVAILAQAQPDRTVPGQVVDDQGKPVAGVRVVLYAPSMWQGPENTAETETAIDAEGRFWLKFPHIGRRNLTTIGILAYRPGTSISAATISSRHRERYVVRMPEPRIVKVVGPDGRAVAGARMAPRVVAVFGENPVDVPASLADPLTVTTGPDGTATLHYPAARDQLAAARVTAEAIGAQDILLVERPGQGPVEPVITIRLTKTSRLSGRVVDEGRRPIAGQEVEIWSRGNNRWLRPSRVELPGGPLRTAAAGSFWTPENLFVGSSYRVVVRAPRKQTILSDWIAIRDQTRMLLPMRLGALRTISGRVVDRQGKPVAGVEVFQTGDGPEPTATRSGPEGRFALGAFRPGRVFVFARGDGFRFHGQLLREDESEVVVELTRMSERPARAMHVLPEPIPLEESRALARRLVEPVWKAVATKGNDRAKADVLGALANADPVGTLEKLESEPFASKLWEFRIRTAVAVAMVESDPDEAAGVAGSVTDPGMRAAAWIELADALPAGRRDLRLAWLDRAAPDARAEVDAIKRLRLLGDVAERWYVLGEVEKARTLFAEGLRVAMRVPDKHETDDRAYFATQIAPVDPEAALAMAREWKLKGYRGGIYWRVALGLQIFERDPADALFFWRESRGFPRMPYFVSSAWRMAVADPARARRAIGYIPWISELCDTPVYLALAEMGRDEAAVGRLLDEALRRMDRRMEDPLGGAGQPIGFVLPVVERIDQARVPEFFWREVASRQASDNPRTTRLYSPIAVIPYLAWYDREAAAALFELTRERIERTDDHELATWAKQFAAWSQFDPRGAAVRLERVPVRPDPASDANAPHSPGNRCRKTVARCSAANWLPGCVVRSDRSEQRRILGGGGRIPRYGSSTNRGRSMTGERSRPTSRRVA
jgi:hypothetical protein